MKVKTTEEIGAKIGELPPDLKREVLDYIDFLVNKYSKKRKKEKLKFDWEGGLSDLKEKYTSVQLQHESTNWR
jgi:hypothetical protein